MSPDSYFCGALDRLYGRELGLSYLFVGQRTSSFHVFVFDLSELGFNEVVAFVLLMPVEVLCDMRGVFKVWLLLVVSTVEDPSEVPLVSLCLEYLVPQVFCLFPRFRWVLLVRFELPRECL